MRGVAWERPRRDRGEEKENRVGLVLTFQPPFLFILLFLLFKYKKKYTK